MFNQYLKCMSRISKLAMLKMVHKGKTCNQSVCLYLLDSHVPFMCRSYIYLGNRAVGKLSIISLEAKLSISLVSVQEGVYPVNQAMNQVYLVFRCIV
jgi:hypothetical protein